MINGVIFGYTYSNEASDVLPAGVASEKNQIDGYGGFYIARYEAGVPDNQITIDGTSSESSNTSGIPVSKRDQTCWTNIDYINAKLSAESMYNSSSVKSGLITGTMWDTILKYLKISGKNVEDSRTWGNHSDSEENAAIIVGSENKYGSIQKTAYSNFWRAKNIYDFAGNVKEWTNEYYLIETSNYMVRGGDCYASGLNDSVSSRNISLNTNTYFSVGFRVCLYIL